MVSCKFIAGSRSRGCHVKLIEHNLVLESYNISRDVGLEYVTKEFAMNDLKELNIVVFDWEADGSIGSLAHNVDIQFMRAVSTEALSPNSGKKSE